MALFFLAVTVPFSCVDFLMGSIPLDWKSNPYRMGCGVFSISERVLAGCVINLDV